MTTATTTAKITTKAIKEQLSSVPFSVLPKYPVNPLKGRGHKRHELPKGLFGKTIWDAVPAKHRAVTIGYSGGWCHQDARVISLEAFALVSHIVAQI